jgi:uncharacterized protein YuzE
MKITFDPEVNALYIQLIESQIVDSEAVESGIIYDYDADDRIVGIEILAVTNHLPELAAKELPFQNEAQQLEFVAFLEEIESQSLAKRQKIGGEMMQNQGAILKAVQETLKPL